MRLATFVLCTLALSSAAPHCAQAGAPIAAPKASGSPLEGTWSAPAWGYEITVDLPDHRARVVEQGRTQELAFEPIERAGNDITVEIGRQLCHFYVIDQATLQFAPEGESATIPLKRLR